MVELENIELTSLLRDKTPKDIGEFIEKAQEQTRSGLVYFLLAILIVSLVFAFVYILIGELDPESKKELIILILTSQTTLVGTALGFYFGKK